MNGLRLGAFVANVRQDDPRLDDPRFGRGEPRVTWHETTRELRARGMVGLYELVEEDELA